MTFGKGKQSWTEEQRKKWSIDKLGNKNPLWKDSVGYRALHRWVERNLSKPKSCPLCDRNVRLEAANISGNYLRDLSDWYYLCRRCHMLTDGRMSNLKQYAR